MFDKLSVTVRSLSCFSFQYVNLTVLRHRLSPSFVVESQGLTAAYANC